MSEKCEAIVIATLNYKDSDKIFTFFTKELGIVTAIGKNLRKSNSKRSYNLDTINAVKLNLHYSNNYYFVTDAQVVNNFSLIKKSLVFVGYTLLVLESTNIFVPPGEPNLYMYNLLLNTLSNLNKLPKKRYIYKYLINLLQNAGFWDTEYFTKYPSLQKIVNDQELKILEEEQYKIDYFLINLIERLGEKDLESKKLLFV